MMKEDKLKEIKRNMIFNTDGFLKSELTSANDLMRILEAETEEELDEIIVEIINGKKEEE